jgi:lipid-binding SYLF domain-containing protein
LTRRTALASGLAVAGASLAGVQAAEAATAAELDQRASAALRKLYADSPKAKQLAAKSRAILIFPKVAKAGFVFGAQGGEGVLRVHGKTAGYYNTVAASFGLQAGVQVFGYALFFITQSALDYLKKSEGWAIGAGPSVVVVDAGLAKTLDTTNLTQDVYAIPFGQKGLMAGITLEGSKISRIHPK